VTMKALPAIALSALAICSCSKLPRPGFTFSPEENPESGDTIRFINTSKNAVTYQWDFGDGGLSYEAEPSHIFEEAGVFEVVLSASNDQGSQPFSQSITIHEPTILGFMVYDSTETLPIPGAEIRVYETEADRDCLCQTPWTGVTDSSGTMEFRNLEPVIYHVWVSKEVPGGFWTFRGYTFQLKQNKVNYYRVPCSWSEDQ
jgi:PKD repeat protein